MQNSKCELLKVFSAQFLQNTF